MTLTFTLVLACAAANGCVCVCHEQSPFERQCHERGGQVVTASTSQRCVMDGGSVSAESRTDDDAGG